MDHDAMQAHVGHADGLTIVVYTLFGLWVVWEYLLARYHGQRPDALTVGVTFLTTFVFVSCAWTGYGPAPDLWHAFHNVLAVGLLGVAVKSRFYRSAFAARDTLQRAESERDGVEEIRRQYAMLARTIAQDRHTLFGRWDEDGLYTLSQGGALPRIGQEPGQRVGQPIEEDFRTWGALEHFEAIARQGEDEVTYHTSSPVGGRTEHLRVTLRRDAAARSPKTGLWAGYFMARVVTESVEREAELDALREAAEERANEKTQALEGIKRALYDQAEPGRDP